MESEDKLEKNINRDSQQKLRLLSSDICLSHLSVAILIHKKVKIFMEGKIKSYFPHLILRIQISTEK